MSNDHHNIKEIDILYKLSHLCKPKKEENNIKILNNIISMLQQINKLEISNDKNIKTKKSLHQLRDDTAKETIECLPSIFKHFDIKSQQITVPKVVEK